MNRKLFLKKLVGALCALPIISRLASAKSEPEIKALEEDFFKSANALNRYREARGLNPGVRVQTQSRFGDPSLIGVIAPYGDDWYYSDHYSVPVIFDKPRRRCQPWSMSDLTIIEP